jgi:hypothetical protein
MPADGRVIVRARREIVRGPTPRLRATP